MRRADIEVPNRFVDVDSWKRSACYPRSTFYPLSDGNSTLYRRITKTYFRTCSTCWSRSQAPLCLDTVPRPDNGTELEAQNTKGGIPRAAPQRLASLVHSLPPILDKMSQTPISSCSKGSRGLSVFLRVIGIFTDTTISPSPSLRQRPSRYAIRAGRNLPDKEFRYLRTVIVTAAVYRGLDSKLRPKANLSS